MDKELVERIKKFQELPTDQKWFVIQDALMELSGSLTSFKKEVVVKKKGKK